MKLIIEKTDNTIYAYREDDTHHARVESQRVHLENLDITLLDEDCDLASYPENSYFVIDILDKQ